MSNQIIMISSVLFMMAMFVFSMSFVAYKTHRKNKLKRNLRRTLIVKNNNDFSLREIFNFKFVKLEKMFVQAGIDTIYMEDIIIFCILLMTIAIGFSIVLDYGVFLLIVPIILISVFIGYVKKKATKRIEKINNQFCSVLDDLADNLRVNSNLYIGMKNCLPVMSSPLKEEFELVLQNVESNIDIIVALQNLSNRLNSNIIQGWVDAVIFASEKKSNVSDICKKYAKKIRKRLRYSKEIKGKLQGIKSMALMVLGILGMMIISFYSSDPQFSMFLKTSIGKIMSIYTLISIIVTTIFIFSKIDKEVADI